MADGTLLLVVGALLAGGIAVSQVGDRLRVPGLVLVIGLGMAIGSDGLGWLHFDDYELAKTIGVIALVAILFEGGLAAGFPEIRPVLKPALALALLGTTLTAIFAGLAASWLLHFSLLEGLLLGSILGLIVLVWFHSPGLSAVIAIALTCNLLFAALAGVLVPLTLKRFGFDPALASGIFLTAVTDSMGFFTFLGLATLVLLH